MKPVLIIEHCTSGLKLNENAISSDPRNKYLMEGTFTELDVKNRNERIYTAKYFLPHLQELLERKKQLGVIYGEFDHPDVFDTSLSRVSHVLENAWFDQEANKIQGEIRLLSTHWGKEARALVDDGLPIFVSSRAAGVTESNGTVQLKKLFTYDIVADPGFGSAKMSVKSLNESAGYSADTNFRIFELNQQDYSKYSKIFDLSNEEKTNELFNMNKNDIVTKKQLTQYSDYLISQIKQVERRLITEAATPEVKAGVEQLAEYYEALQEQHNKIIGYLDYVAEQLSVVVEKNETLERKTEKIIEHNDYLAESIEKNIEYSEYLAENLDKTIEYGEYLAENLDKTIEYSEYIAENLDKTIAYGEYIAENLNSSIQYSEYLAENLDTNIAYSEYLAENLDTNIAYSEYLAENLDANIAYSEYIAESVDKTLDYAGLIAEKINSSKSGIITENIDLPREYLSSFGGDDFGAELGGVDMDERTFANEFEEQLEEEENGEVELTDDHFSDSEFGHIPTQTETEEETEPLYYNDNCATEETEEETSYYLGTEEEEQVTESLTTQIDKLILEAMKKEASKIAEPHFYRFLNRSQISAFENLSDEEQTAVKVALNESAGYWSNGDVLKIMQQSLSYLRNETPEENLLKNIPSDIKPLWESLSNSEQASVIAQSKFYSITNESQIEHFWRTRKIKAINAINEGKTLLDETHPSLKDSLSSEQIDSFMKRFKGFQN